MTASPNSVAIRLLVLIVAIGAVFLLLTSVGAAGELPPPTDTYVVAAGDTLWDIAAVITPAGGDVREAVDVIVEVNGLSGGTIHPGQSLLIPRV